jgi:hypothetical protein
MVGLSSRPSAGLDLPMASRRLAAGLFICVSMGSGSALAINWEGHEDWLADSPPALELQRHFDRRVAPLPSNQLKPSCQKREDVGRVPANPYEPVPMLCNEEDPLRLSPE